jgi:DNA-binding LacI/PurR family transcriptional regulator
LATSGEGGSSRRVLRIAVMASSPLSEGNAHSNELSLSVMHHIKAAGHECIEAPSAKELNYNLKRIGKVVADTKADAWLLFSASREMLEWFAGQGIACYALGGHLTGLAIPGSVVSLPPMLSQIVDALAAQGHRRIVFISPKVWRLPQPSPIVVGFLEALARHGLKPSVYNAPDWEEDGPGLSTLLNGLFKATPPTALIMTEACGCIGALSFLARRGLQVPKDVSVVTLQSDPTLAWHEPEIAHLKWPVKPYVRHIARWVDALVHGGTFLDQARLSTELVQGSSIGPVRAR